MLLVVLTTGCAPCRRTGSVEADLHDHLESVYGETFAVTMLRRAQGTYGEPKPFTNLFVFRAHPVRDPGLEIKGNVDYSGWGAPEFRDDYACAQVRTWLPDAVDSALGRRRRLQDRAVLCTPGGLPPHPAQGEPLPAGAVTLRARLAVFDEGDSVAVVDAARTDLHREAERLGIRVSGRVTAYPPDALSAAEAWQPRKQTRQPAERWDPLVRAQADSSDTDPPVAWPRDTELEATAAATIRGLRPQARIAVWAAREPGSKSPVRLDVRVAEPGLDQGAMDRIAKELESAIPGHTIHVTGLDTSDPQGPQRAGFVCLARCEPTSALLIGPDALR